MRKIITYILVFTLLLSSITVYAAQSATPIDERIFTLQSLGIINDFEADKKVTRLEAVTAIVKMLVDNTPDLYEGDIGFSDVADDHPEAGYVYYGKQLGIIAGVYNSIFEPMGNITHMQMIKMAVAALGYGAMAEDEGGYPEGYISVAVKYNLVRNMSGLYEEEATMQDMVYLLDNMLSTYPLELKYGTGNYRISQQTLYDQIIERRNQSSIEGIVTAVGDTALKDEKSLRENEISIDGLIYKYDGDDAFEYLGKSVIAYYTEENNSVIISIYEQDRNKEIIIDSNDIDSFIKTELIYNSSDYRTETLRINSDANFIYNYSSYTPGEDEIKIKSGEVRMLDNDNDEIYDVVFINEYESFIIDRISSINNTIYFQKDILYRGKSGFKIDYDDRNKKYSIYDIEGNNINFEDIQEGSVVTIQSDIEQKNNVIIISNETVRGEITEVIKDDDEIKIDATLYKLYEPNAEELLDEYRVGQEGQFILNHKNEIVGTDGRIYSESSYGYVIGINRGRSLLTTPQLKVVSAGTSEKIIEISGNEERITYTYINDNEARVLELADRIYYTGPRMTEDQPNILDNYRLTAGSINLDVFHRAAIMYTLNSAGKINRIQVTKIPGYETAKLESQYAYNFNGKLNSFGGFSSKDAFFIGETTEVICIPTNNRPGDDDYHVDVTISDNSTCTIIPLAIDEKTQVAECAILIESMDASTPKPFKETTKVSIVGKMIQGIDEEGERTYKLEVLTGNKIETPYIRSGSNNEEIVSALKCGDLIKYNTKSSGEIDNIKHIKSMASLGNKYDISKEGSNEETVFAQAYSIVLNRLDDFRNEMIDILTVYTGDKEKSYTILRENAPTVYSYNKRTGAIMMAEIDEILTYDEIGEGASQVYMFVNQNNPEVIVMIQD
jgi:hypothetical protein